MQISANQGKAHRVGGKGIMLCNQIWHNMLCQNELYFLMLFNQICTLRPNDQLCRIAIHVCV